VPTPIDPIVRRIDRLETRMAELRQMADMLEATMRNTEQLEAQLKRGSPRLTLVEGGRNAR
jgi:hypothetical protein